MGKERMILAVFLLFLSFNVQSQVSKKRELGIRVAYGIVNQVLPEGDIYRPLLILPYFNYYLSKREKRSKFSVYAEPQLTPVFVEYQNSGKDQFEKEIGINGGVMYSYWFNWFTLYAGIGSGPDYISVFTRRQAHGFIFSDNLFGGLKTHIAKDYYLDLHIRLRHISNAGLDNPNKGINNLFAGAGVSRFF